MNIRVLPKLVIALIPNMMVFGCWAFEKCRLGEVMRLELP